jgi:hypothetical protein
VLKNCPLSVSSVMVLPEKVILRGTSVDFRCSISAPSWRNHLSETSRCNQFNRPARKKLGALAVKNSGPTRELWRFSGKVRIPAALTYVRFLKKAKQSQKEPRQ